MSDNPKILIVDDETDVQDIYSKSFESQGYTVDCCSNGSEADFKSTKNTYNTIITDVNMPYINGIDFIKNIREGHANKTTPIVVVSAHLSKNVIIQLATMNVAKIFTKPIRLKEFVSFVNETANYAGGELDKLSQFEKKDEAHAQPTQTNEHREEEDEVEIAS